MFQPVIFATMAMSAASFASAAPTRSIPLSCSSSACRRCSPDYGAGFELYGRLDDAAFRRVILLLLLVSGLTLVIPLSLFR